MAPECATRKGITDKADVYSYGILLLEIVSGKSNSKSEDNDYLLNKVRKIDQILYRANQLGFQIPLYI